MRGSVVNTPGTSARLELAKMIKAARRAREVNGRPMTQAYLGTMIGYSQGHINKLESGDYRIERQPLGLIIECLDVDPATRSRMWELCELNLRVESMVGERGVVPDYFRKYRKAEQSAETILNWHEMRIPGPLQSEHYMLAHFQASGAGNVTALVMDRTARQSLFRRGGLRRYTCVLAEEALRKDVYNLGTDVVLDEIDHLLVLNDPIHPHAIADERTSVHLLPTVASVPFMPGDFSLVRCPDQNILYIEFGSGGMTKEGRREVERQYEIWHNLFPAALSRDDTNAMLRRLRAELAELDA